MIRNSLQCFNGVRIYLLFLVLLDTSQADDVGVFWGQERDEGSLGETCATGKYSYVNIAFLDAFDNLRTPEINLGDHCFASSNGCSFVGSCIRSCQKQGIKVMLSVRSFNVSDPGHISPNDSTHFSDYLWNNFLGGNSSSRPLGDAVLDGIDFATDSNYWEDVARYLKSSSKQNIYLSASFLCSFDNSENSTVNDGLLDYLWVMFLDSSQCQYWEGNFDNLISSWNQWTKLKVGKIFLGLVASPDAGASGYIHADLLISQILPSIRKPSNYGGVMLWSRYYDGKSGYSDSIINPLCKQQDPHQCSSRDINFTESFGYMSMASFRINESEEIRHCCEVICRNNCSCGAYAPTNYVNNTGCQIWSKESTLNKSSGTYGQIIYVATGRQENTLDETSKRRTVITAVGVALAITFICYLSYALWRKYKAEEDAKQKQKKLIHDIGGNAMVAMMCSRAKMIKKEANTNDEAEIFSLKSMVAATNNFSASSKLGEGGFGPVYKGRLTHDREIAIKRLSGSSRQGLVEFKNEAILIAKLQHTNLVRLLGLCIEREERMLVYEYMSNKSLDYHLFDAEKKNVLDWGKSLNIIEGIAQGILYLHKYSNIKVIHRDLKASNILLDDKMNPKISDFGMARILGLEESKEKTNRIVGTYGYMSPEYALNGIISIKLDVFSFGVLLLEILSGKKNNCYYHSDLPLNLIGYAWQLWNEDKALELMDPRLNETCTPYEVLRCMHIGLLCVQDHARDRPTMFDVVSFLSNDAIQLAQQSNQHSSSMWNQNCWVINKKSIP